MTSYPIVDAHVHVLFPDPGDDGAQRDPYEIWEYGDHDGVEVLDLAGTMAEVTAAMEAARCDHFVTANLFAAENELARLGRAGARLDDQAEELRARLIRFNSRVLEFTASRPDTTAFVAADPHVLAGAAGARHVEWAHDRGARGVKIHPVVQRFRPDHPGMLHIYRTCEERGLGVIAHAGASRGPVEWAEPDAYAAVLRAHPRLNLVLAHLGGARWRQAVGLAAAFPHISFDVCEIIAWTGAPGAPTRDELGRMIKEIGPERVLFGTDFPWYDIETTIDQVLALPHLSEEEKVGILGLNAIRVLGLPLEQ